MATKSNIQWTEKTWNPITGCSRVSAGTVRKTPGGRTQFTGRINTVPEVLDQPRTWKPSMVFVNSMSDLFHENVPREFLMEVWKVIRETPQHTYQILTKRPERIEASLPEDWGQGYENVWLGVSIESQAQLGRMDQLSIIPAKIRFLSLEPLIEAINLYDSYTSYPSLGDPANGGEPVLWAINWVIIGGESGRNYREFHMEWVEWIVRQCQDTYNPIPVFVKQLGTHLAKKMGLKDKKGGDPAEWPEHLRIREFPNVNILNY